MITKNFKTTLTYSTLTILLMLTGCLHNPEVPFVQPNRLGKNETISIEKIGSIIFSDLLFESPLGERAFSSVKFEFDDKNQKIVTLTKLIKELIKKESTIYYSAQGLKNPTYNIKFITSKDQRSIKIILIDNYTKKEVYSKAYRIQTQ